MATLYEEVRTALRQLDFKPRKRLGQNFLVHQHVVDSIVRLLEPSPQDEILEIGPGLGFLTRRLVERVAKVWAVEVDAFLVDWLQRSSLGHDPRLQLVHADILKLALGDLLPPHQVKLVGNLPYSISTPVLFRLFEWREHFSSLVLMVQKEVADRIASAPGSKTYGALSVWCQVHGRVTDRLTVSPEAFYPRPKVRSTVLKLALYPEPLIAVQDLATLRAVARAAFGQRRKTLSNALTAGLKKDRKDVETFLRSQRIDAGRRGETLTVEEFLRLARTLKPSGLLRPQS
ncbi:MAG TPA: 16S rRNA (adenine(1518)-N(6)/adenine(1519)-N(6))-dimethyltransferase RsmA [Candidatus Binatia bacterium]|nr:16S rRNA (adenine(1518)-N(6)/adenine(1519)-N(6))-dimethyltransferase RsmA [Candidatus Binatia bacterium]